MSKYDEALVNSKKTAISRRGISAPLKRLIALGEFEVPHHDWPSEKILHHGAGRRNNPDRAELDRCGSYVYHYDPYHGASARSPLGCSGFDKVFSAYVLNVLPTSARLAATEDIVNSMSPSGSAYIAVRSHKNMNVGPKWSDFDDGHLVPNKGFQKGFASSELYWFLLDYFDSVVVEKLKSGDLLAICKVRIVSEA